MKKFSLQNWLALVALFAAISVKAATINVTSDITSNTTWTNDNIYILFGDIIVKNGATLTIQPGTIIRGDKTTLSRLVISTTGKIYAQGTPEQPIIFTSNQPAGSRARADWAGIAICGLAPVNFKDGGGNPTQGRIECGTTTDYDYGGNNPDDSSGVLSYVRIEYAGYVCGSNNELNSLTMGGVGRKTKIDHIQVSYGQDDGFEWFGGTANAKHLISFAQRDDDFDTDNGFSGKVQYGIAVRIDTIADQGDISNGFESDNDANGTTNTPFTTGTFSNITVVGPAATTSSVIDAKYGWALRLRRNTSLSVFNSMFIGYKRGLRIEGTSTQTNATSGSLEFKNNIIAGSKEQYYETSFDSLYLLAQPSNTIFGGNANDSVNLVSPYGNPAAYDFRPQAGSPALSGADFSNSKLSGLTATTYRGALGSDEQSDWTNCWSEFTPQDEDYTTVPVNYAYSASLNASGPTTFCQGDSVNLSVSGNNLTYRWSTGATSASIIVKQGGTYSVTVSNARGCKKFFSQTVTVNTNPSAPTVSASTTSFCTGQSVQISSSAANNYAWNNGSNTQQITVTTGGNYTVTITDANNCSASASVSITQNTPVAATVTALGNTTFCTGGSVNIVVNNAGNYTAFSWSNNETNDTITVTTSGTYTVTTTDANGCTIASSNSITTSVSNSPSPTITASGAVNFCEGDSVILTSSVADSYSWSNGATTQSITVTTSGNYIVTVTNSDQCLGTGPSAPKTVTVTPQPEASFTTAAGSASYTINFTNTSTDATTYAWDFGNNQTSTAANPTHTYTQNGTYTVTLTATNGNCTDVFTAQVTVVGVGVEEVVTSLETVRLYPNPNNGSAILEVSTTQASEVSIRVADIAGREVMLLNSTLASGTNAIELNTSELNNGIYFVAISNGSQTNAIRMVVNR